MSPRRTVLTRLVFCARYACGNESPRSAAAAAGAHHALMLRVFDRSRQLAALQTVGAALAVCGRIEGFTYVGPLQGDPVATTTAAPTLRPKRNRPIGPAALTRSDPRAVAMSCTCRQM
ncbi:hypothetical protein GCM10027167_10520 [Nocardia heshunensis]